MSGSSVTSLVILGSGGHAKVILDACLLSDIPVAGFLSKDHPVGTTLHTVPVLGDDDRLDDPDFVAAHQFIVGLGDLALRRSLIARVGAAGGRFATIIHPAATVSPRATIGSGSFINAGAVINIDARIAEQCIINTNVSIDHDCTLGENTHICPGATLAGGVAIGAHGFVGSGAVITPYRRIGDNVVVGAGRVILSDLPDNSVVTRP